MRIEIRLLAGLCVVAAAVTIGFAQQQPPPTQTTVTTTKTKTTTIIPQVPHVTVKHKPKARARVRSKHRVVRRRRRPIRRHRRVIRITHITKTTLTMTSGAETGLVGLKLFDSGMKVLSMYGNPDLILNLGQAVPTAGAGPSGGGIGGRGGGAFGGPGGPRFGGQGGEAFGPRGPGGQGGQAGAQGGRRGGASVGSTSFRDVTGDSGQDWSFEDDTLDRLQGGSFGAGGLSAGGGPRFGGGQGPPPGFRGPGGPAGAGGFGGAGAQGAGAQVGSGTGPTSTYMRWVYKRTASQYSFIIDRLDRVVQIEVTGMGDPKVRTNKGVTFGATFKELMTKYGIPDAYEINGDQLVMRYLSKDHVAFRLNRLQTDQPHEVTAIVVAGGRG